MKYLLYILYALYLFLLVATNLTPNNGWHSIWIVAVLAFTTIAFFQISERVCTSNARASHTPTLEHKPHSAASFLHRSTAIR